MAGLFCLIMATPGLRAFFELAALGPRDYAIVAAVVAIWGATVRYAWRRRVLERAIGTDFGDSNPS